MHLQSVNTGKALCVLDMASPGVVSQAYERCLRKSFPRIEIKSFEIPVHEAMRLNGEVRKGIVSIKRRAGRLPECLTSEENGHYDDAHLHMADSHFGEEEALQIFSETDRIMKKGGTFFFSANGEFASGGSLNVIFIDSIIAKNFSIIYRFYDGKGIESVLTEQAGEIANLFGKSNLDCKKDSALQFFSLFSNYAERGEYYVIAKKKE